MSDIEMLVIQARGAYSTSRVVTGLAAAVEALQAQLAEANKVIDAIETLLLYPDRVPTPLSNRLTVVLAEYRKKATS